ncbi:MAG: hypothetical protein HQM08_07750 [Candidatus Riflebacteria bacterium]|nr:hypothetical protein [Candidatus Riflebacteria bacterium]
MTEKPQEIPSSDPNPQLTASPDLFQANPVLRGIGFLLSLLIFQMVFKTTFLLLLERPRIAILAFIAVLSILAQVAVIFSDILLLRFNYRYPGVLLWAQPISILTVSYSFFLILIAGIPRIFGRAFWSSLLDLNAKCVTSFFSTLVGAISLYVLFSILVAAGRLVKSILLKTIQNFAKMHGEDEELKDIQNKTRKVNRIAFYIFLGLLLLTASWTVFFKPETILYLRAQIQLQTMIHPEAALAAFKQIQTKFPNYEYLDTIEFRCSWIKDRRIKNYSEAAIDYEDFLKKYGYENIWSEDAITNLIRIKQDKLNDPVGVLSLVDLYQKYFPTGHFGPHIVLYKIRALRDVKKEKEANELLASSLEKYKTTNLILYDNEDDYVGSISFTAAAKVL